MSESGFEILVLGAGDERVLEDVADGVLDNAINPVQRDSFLACASHFMVVARAQGQVIGMASAVVHLHPDKPPQVFVNEVATADAWQMRGVATAVMARVIAEARARGADHAWLGTEQENMAALALYRSLGAREAAGLVLFEWDELDGD